MGLNNSPILPGLPQSVCSFHSMLWAGPSRASSYGRTKQQRRDQPKAFYLPVLLLPCPHWAYLDLVQALWLVQIQVGPWSLLSLGWRHNISTLLPIFTYSQPFLNCTWLIPIPAPECLECPPLLTYLVKGRLQKSLACTFHWQPIMLGAQAHVLLQKLPCQ